MKKSRYSEAQIVSVLKEAESGVPVSELCRTHGMSCQHGLRLSKDPKIVGYYNALLHIMVPKEGVY